MTREYSNLHNSSSMDVDCDNPLAAHFRPEWHRHCHAKVGTSGRGLPSTKESESKNLNPYDEDYVWV